MSGRENVPGDYVRGGGVMFVHPLNNVWMTVRLRIIACWTSAVFRIEVVYLYCECCVYPSTKRRVHGFCLAHSATSPWGADVYRPNCTRVKIVCWYIAVDGSGSGSSDTAVDGGFDDVEDEVAVSTSTMNISSTDVTSLKLAESTSAALIRSVGLEF